jgi:hypothetical protein
MKLTVSKGTHKVNPKSENQLRADILVKLHDLLVGCTSHFFTWKNSDLCANKCANVNLHNRLVILLALFTDSNYNSGTYTQFYNPVAFCGYDNVEKLLALEAFVDSIPSLLHVKIELE